MAERVESSNSDPGKGEVDGMKEEVESSNGGVKLLKNIVLRSDWRGKHSRAEVRYPDIKNEIFRNTTRNYDQVPYTSCPVPDENLQIGVEKYGVVLEASTIKEATESEFVKRAVKFKKDETSPFTYEHVLISLLHSADQGIVLVGPYGSGKSHRLNYIWNYIVKHERYEDCKCVDPLRRLAMVVIRQDHETVMDFYVHTFERIIYLLDELTYSFGKDDYKLFVESVEKKAAEGHAPDYWPTVVSRLGVLNDPNNIPSLQELEAKLSKIPITTSPHYRALIEFAMDFLAWLRQSKFRDRLCIAIFFDNIDLSPRNVQKAVLGLAALVPVGLATLCAVREETWVNYFEEGSAELFCVPHVGASAYQVVLSRIDHYLEEYKKAEQRIAGYKSLPGFEDEKFIGNLRYLRGKIGVDYFRGLFDQLFESQARNALYFAENIIDLAKSYSGDQLKKWIEGRSVYALERLLYSPYGLITLTRSVINIFSVHNEYEGRLWPLKVLLLLRKAAMSDILFLRVSRICESLSLFGCDQETSLQILKELLDKRLIVGKTSEKEESDDSPLSPSEKIRLTEIGTGMTKKFSDFGYIQVVMFFTLCAEKEYAGLSQIAGIPGVEEVLEIAQRFVQEVKDLEEKELMQIKQKGRLNDYRKAFGSETAAVRMYVGTIGPAAAIITRLSRQADKSTGLYGEMRRVLMNLYSQYIALINNLRDNYGFELREDRLVIDKAEEVLELPK